MNAVDSFRLLTWAQPSLFIGGMVYSIGLKAIDGMPVLRSVVDVDYPLRPLVSWSSLAAQYIRAMRTVWRTECETVVSTALRSSASTLLAWAVELFDAVENKTFGRSPGISYPRAADERVLIPLSVGDELEAILEESPRPSLPFDMAIGMLGRCWELAEMPPRKGTIQVFCNDRVYRMTGLYVFFGKMLAAWRAQRRRKLANRVRELAASLALKEPPRVAAARRELTAKGYLQCGDLIFFAHETPVLCHLTPPHQNKVIGRVDGNLAVGVVLQGSRAFTLYRLQNGKWSNFSHHLCLGPGIPSLDPEADGLHLVGVLRAAAARIALNGRFHEAD